MMRIEADQQYEQLLDAVTSYWYTVRFENGHPAATQHNCGSTATTGYKPGDYEADPFLWIEMVHPDDREQVRSHIWRVLNGERRPPVEHRIVRKDGMIRWVRDTLVVHYDEQGVIVRYDGLVEDITERKWAEERFSKLVESAPDAMVITDQQGQIVLVNAQTEVLFGFTREELLGQRVEILLPSRFHERHTILRETYCVSPTNRPMAERPELCGVRRDGSEFPAEVCLSPIEIEEGVLISASIRDITERIRMRERIVARDAELMAVQKIQEHLLPHHAPAVPGFDIAASSYPAERAAGDHYDYLTLPDASLGIVVGDVSGHGLGSALLMASTHAHIRSFAATHADIGDVLTHVNSILCREFQVGRFVTLLLTRIDVRSGLLKYVNAGHPSGYVLNAQGVLKSTLSSTTIPLAIDETSYFPVSGTIKLDTGDMVVLCTDGVLEARSGGGELFGSGRLLACVRDQQEGSAGEVVESLHSNVVQFAGRDKLEDDFTAVVIKVVEPPGMT
jgi:sigma-B regulation protein RsbU (phosphoserine phosphatase)